MLKGISRLELMAGPMFMETGEGGAGDPNPQNPPANDPPNDPASTDPKDVEIAALRREQAERRKTNEKLQKQLDEIKRNQDEATRKAAEEKGEYKDLYETLNNEHETLKQRADRYAQALDNYLKAEIEQIPEQFRPLLDPIEGTDAKLAWIAQAKSAKLFTTTTGPGVRDAGENTIDSLEAQYDAAVKSGNSGDAIKLKRLIHQKKHRT